MSNHYQEQREQDHFVNKTSTPEVEKDLWQTPRDLFNVLNREFDFQLDSCASKENTLCKYFFSEENSALENEWNKPDWFSISTEIKSVFINPPYSQTQAFINRAAQQAKLHNLTVVALVNANTDVNWFSNAVSTANEVRLITGRISFVKPDGTKGKGQNSKGQALIIWRGNCQTTCQITMINRRDLEC